MGLFGAKPLKCLGAADQIRLKVGDAAEARGPCVPPLDRNLGRRAARHTYMRSRRTARAPPPPPAPPLRDAPSICAAPNPRTLFAVLGVITNERSRYRHSIRLTWLPSPEADVVTKLVMRGFNVSAEVLDEAARFGDVVFLPSSASLDKNLGPVQSTWQWLECAVSAWPRANLIGKAEDDVWIHMPGVMESLRAGSAALNELGVDAMFWGMMETYFWNTTHQRPMGFGHVRSYPSPANLPP